MDKYPELNGHAVGILLKELVRRAMLVARRHTLTFEVNQKVGYSGEMNDVFTNADCETQAVYVKSLKECFPGIGIIGEEDALVVPSASGNDAYFTIDPIDGTKAYVRRQSHGVGSMIALVIRGEVVAAYIGDVCSGEIYGFRPDSSSVWRITNLEMYERLEANPSSIRFRTSHLLLRDREKDHGETARQTMDCFNGISVDGGSIGIWMARLWKREVQALILKPSWETPWDSTPVVGISRKLGYMFLRPVGSWWESYEPSCLREKEWRGHDTLVLHRNDFDELYRHFPIVSG